MTWFHFNDSVSEIMTSKLWETDKPHSSSSSSEISWSAQLIHSADCSADTLAAAAVRFVGLSQLWRSNLPRKVSWTGKPGKTLWLRGLHSVTSCFFAVFHFGILPVGYFKWFILLSPVLVTRYFYNQTKHQQHFDHCNTDHSFLIIGAKPYFWRVFFIFFYFYFYCSIMLGKYIVKDQSLGC